MPKFVMKNTKYYQHLIATTPTTRVCSEDGCESPADRVKGHYTFDKRRVRVWVCFDHRSTNPLQELPLPASLQAALKADEEFLAKQAKFYKNHGDFDGGKGVSVKLLSNGGWGEPIPNDRVKSWRWGA